MAPLQASGVLLWHDDIDEDCMALWRGRGLTIVAWTVNEDADKKRLAELGCPFMSDYIAGGAMVQGASLLAAKTAEESKTTQ